VRIGFHDVPRLDGLEDRILEQILVGGPWGPSIPASATGAAVAGRGRSVSRDCRLIQRMCDIKAEIPRYLASFCRRERRWQHKLRLRKWTPLLVSSQEPAGSIRIGGLFFCSKDRSAILPAAFATAARRARRPECRDAPSASEVVAVGVVRPTRVRSVARSRAVREAGENIRQARAGPKGGHERRSLIHAAPLTAVARELHDVAGVAGKGLMRAFGRTSGWSFLSHWFRRPIYYVKSRWSERRWQNDETAAQ
jgi:hypothetical protein